MKLLLYCDGSKTRSVQLKTEPYARQTVVLHFLVRVCVCVFVCVCVCVHNAYIILVCNTTYCMLADGNDLLQRPDMLDLLNSFINYYLKHLS